MINHGVTSQYCCWAKEKFIWGIALWVFGHPLIFNGYIQVEARLPSAEVKIED